MVEFEGAQMSMYKYNSSFVGSVKHWIWIQWGWIDLVVVWDKPGWALWRYENSHSLILSVSWIMETGVVDLFLQCSVRHVALSAASLVWSNPHRGPLSLYHNALWFSLSSLKMPIFTQRCLFICSIMLIHNSSYMFYTLSLWKCEHIVSFIFFRHTESQFLYG